MQLLTLSHTVHFPRRTSIHITSVPRRSNYSLRNQALHLAGLDKGGGEEEGEAAMEEGVCAGGGDEQI
jgi:hypothetical protein